MFNIPPKFWKDVLTEKDGESYELQRLFLFITLVLSVIAFFWGCGLETVHFYHTNQFDLQSFFQAVATFFIGETLLLGGGAAAIYFKTKTEQPTVTK